VHTVQFILTISKSKPTQKRLEYLNFMNIASQKLLMDSPTTASLPGTPAIPASQASMASTSTSYLRSPGAIPPKQAPAKDPPPLAGWEKIGKFSCYSFHPQEVTLLHPRDVKRVSETKISLKPGGTARSVGFLCMQGNVTPHIITSRHTKMPKEGMLKISGFYLPQVK
jgi:hypothetical protein